MASNWRLESGRSLPPDAPRRRLRHDRRALGSPVVFLAATLALLWCFREPLADLARLAWDSDMYSHTLLVPAISGYFAWAARKRLPARVSSPAWAAGFFLGAGVMAVWWLAFSGGGEQDGLPAAVLSLLAFLTGLIGLFFGRAWLRALAFPLAFLVFMVPWPAALAESVEGFLQRGSTLVAEYLFGLAGMPVLRDGLVLQLPGFSMEVAPECSGIRSTLVLVITSVLASRLFLRQPAHRLLLCAAMVPLALLRNGLRVFVIGQLCVRVGPEMIHSVLHRHGGPLFFALSLVPFSALLYFLWRRESSHVPASLD